MATDWLMIRHDLVDDPRVIQMAIALGCDPDLVTGKLVRIWTWADRHTIDGRVDGLDFSFVDGHVNCPGFADTMRKVDWLRAVDDGIIFPDFHKYNTQTAKQRARDAQRKRASRGKKCGKRTPKARPTDDGQMSAKRPEKTTAKPVTRPDPTRPDPTRPDPTRPDKTRQISGRSGADVVESGSDRIGGQTWRQLSAAKILEALGSTGNGSVGRNRRPILAIVREVEKTSDPDAVLDRLIQMADEKRQAGMDNPAAAWTADVKREFGFARTGGPP